jgi:predicted metal-dependent hydrolase
VNFYSKLLKVKAGEISIRSQSSRWGSASKEGRLNFNYNLLKAPMEIIDYVVVHELCHLRVYNHSRKFWRLVESVVPDYKLKRRWLKKNGVRILAKRSELSN